MRALPVPAVRKQTGAAWPTAVAAVVAVAGFAVGWWGRSAIPAAASPGAKTAAIKPAQMAVESGQSFEEAAAGTGLAHRRRLRLAAAAAGLDREGLAAVLEQERQKLTSQQRRDTMPVEALLARYARLDPPAAADWIARNLEDNDEEEAVWLPAVLGPWIEKDPVAAFAWGRALPKGGVNAEINRELCKQLATYHPALALRKLKAREDFDVMAVDELFTRLTETDRRSACEDARQLQPVEMGPAAEAVVKEWLREGDPAEAYQWVMRLPSAETRSRALGTFYGSLVKRDPAAAGRWMLASGRTDLFEHAKDMVSAWAEHDPQAALAWCANLPAALRTGAVTQSIGYWEQEDPWAAAQYAASSPDPAYRKQVKDVAASLADDDRPTALAWAEGLPPGETRTDALNGICGTWAGTEPAACMEYLNRPGHEALRKIALADVITHWANDDPAGLWRASRDFADPEVQEAAAGSALGQIATADPVEASRLFTQLPRKAQPDVVGGIVGQWCESDPVAAATWVAALPDGKARTVAWTNLAGRWSSADPVSAASWVTGQPAEKARDEALNYLLHVSGDAFEPRDIVRMARSIGDGQTRWEALDWGARQWLTQDQKAATAWIKRTTALTDEQRGMLLGN